MAIKCYFLLNHFLYKIFSINTNQEPINVHFVSHNDWTCQTRHFSILVLGSFFFFFPFPSLQKKMQRLFCSVQRQSVFQSRFTARFLSSGSGNFTFPLIITGLYHISSTLSTKEKKKKRKERKTTPKRKQ